MPTLKELYNLRQIRTGSYNICIRAGLEDTDQLISFYDQHGSFRSLPNCGRLLSRELEYLCSYYKGVLELEASGTDMQVQYADMSSGKRAFDLGHIDVLMVVAEESKKYVLQHQKLNGKVGWCIAKKPGINSI